MRCRSQSCPEDKLFLAARALVTDTPRNTSCPTANSSTRLLSARDAGVGAVAPHAAARRFGTGHAQPFRQSAGHGRRVVAGVDQRAHRVPVHARHDDGPSFRIRIGAPSGRPRRGTRRASFALHDAPAGRPCRARFRGRRYGGHHAACEQRVGCRGQSTVGPAAPRKRPVRSHVPARRRASASHPPFWRASTAPAPGEAEPPDRVGGQAASGPGAAARLACEAEAASAPQLLGPAAVLAVHGALDHHARWALQRRRIAGAEDALLLRGARRFVGGRRAGGEEREQSGQGLRGWASHVSSVLVATNIIRCRNGFVARLL